MRVWIICALVAGAIVAAILLLTRDTDGESRRGPREPQPPSALSEKEVQTYVEVAPRFYYLLGQQAKGFQRARIEGGGKPASMPAVRAHLDTLFQKYHLSEETWRTLSRRVEYATNVVREEAVADERRKRIGSDIAQKRRLLEIATDEGEPAIEADIAALEKKLAWKGSPLLDADRKLVGRYFDKLDRVVPKSGGP